MSAKDIIIAPIAAADANACIRLHHYSGKIVQNSQLHLGVFLGGRLEGAMQFGPSLDKRKLIGLVERTPWNGFIELNRMAFSERLPRNSESRALGVALRIIRKTYSHLQWVVSFADATQSGDGTIYRASGFVLTGIRRNTSVWVGPDNSRIDDATVKTSPLRVSRTTVTKGVHVRASNGGATMAPFREAGFRPMEGYQLRYIYFLDPTARQRLTVPKLPFKTIYQVGADMYRGSKRAKQATDGHHPPSDGAAPIRTLQEVTSSVL